MARATFPFAQTSPALPAAGRVPRAGEAAAQATQAAPAAPASPAPVPADATGYRIGWDHARHQLTPPLAHLHAASPVRQGWAAGRTAFGSRTLKAGPQVQQWLALRLAAWQRGEDVEDIQVTPHFLAQLHGAAGGRCPVTRLALPAAGQPADDVVVQRLNPGAAHAAGNLVLLHRSAAEARESLPCDELLALAQRLAEGEPGATLRGLDARAWQRLAVLASFATPLPHGQAATLPLVVMPPNRVRVINPVQALQVMLTLQFTQAGYARRLLTLAALMPSSEARQTFQIFMHTLLARRLAAGQGLDPAATRQAMEDSWLDPLVQRRWQRLALWLTAADCERLLQRASQRGLCVGGGRWLPSSAAVDGWAIATPAPVTLPEDDASVTLAAAAGRPGPRQAGVGLLRRPAPSIARSRGSQKLAS